MLASDSGEAELDTLRRKIDIVDDELLELLRKRFDLVLKVWVFKAENNIPSLQQDRWEQVLADKRLKAERLGLDGEMVADIWNSIHKVAVDVENSIKARINWDNNV